MTDAEPCPDCNGAKQGCGCEDCRRVGGCFVCSPGAIRERLAAAEARIASLEAKPYVIGPLGPSPFPKPLRP